MRNKEKENIDAALVCEDRLREYTWTINEEQAQVVDAVLVFQICGSFEVWPQGTKIEMSVCFCQSDFKGEFGG